MMISAKKKGKAGKDLSDTGHLGLVREGLPEQVAFV